MGLRRALLRIAAVLGVGVLVAAGVFVALVVYYPQPFVEWYAARSLDRRLSFGALQIAWGNPVTVEARDVRLANASWSSEPYMFRAEYVTASLDTDALWRGVLRFRRLRIEKPLWLLERAASGDRNWRFGGGPPKRNAFVLIPKTRAQFPILLDATVRNGKIVLRRAGRPDIGIDFYTLAIRTPDDDKPVRLTVDGAYNGTPVRLNADTESFVQLRDGTAPFGTTLTLAAAPGTINFKGTLGEPLDFEGVKGTLAVDAQNLHDLLQVFNAAAPLRFPLRLAGPFEKRGDHWQVTRGDGRMPSGAFNGSLALDEGGRGEPDRVALDLAFDRLDATTLLAGNRPSSGGIALQPDPAPGALLDAKLAAQTVVYEGVRLNGVKLHGRTRPGDASIDSLSFKLAGGTVEGSASAQAVPAGGKVVASAVAAALDASQIVDLLGGDKREFDGHVDGRLALSLTGPTLAEALKHSAGQVVLTMTQGRVSRDLVERASADLRRLFRTGRGDVPLKCLLAVADIKDGVATVGPVRLRTPDTTFIAGGRADLRTDRVDLAIRSEGGSIFAVKVPLRVTGTFDKMSVHPALGAAGPPVRGAALPQLGPGLRELAAGNPCVR